MNINLLRKCKKWTLFNYPNKISTTYTKTKRVRRYYNKQRPIASHNISIGCFNVRGLNTKKDVWKDYLLKQNLDIVGLTETKCGTLNGSEFIWNDRYTIGKPSGGATIGHKKLMLNHVSVVHKETDIVAIDVTGFAVLCNSFRLIVVYVRNTLGTIGKKELFNKLCSLCTNISPKTAKPVIIMGDFNMDLFKNRLFAEWVRDMGLVNASHRFGMENKNTFNINRNGILVPISIIDYCLITPNIKLDSLTITEAPRINEKYITDHNGIIITTGLPKTWENHHI